MDGAPARVPSDRVRAIAGPAVLDGAAAACAGAATLVVEIAVVRLTAPWFGQGPYVWANAVGVTLLALALGAAVGGRWAARDPAGRAVPFAAAGAAAWLAVAAGFAAPLAAWLVPVDVAADRPLPLSLWASLVATVAALGPPGVVLGALPPVLVARATAEAGRAAGRVSALGTLGALGGCAATGPWLVPAFGARGAVALAGVLAAVAALLTVRPARAVAAMAEVGPSVGPRSRPPHATWLVPVLGGLVVTIVEFTAFRRLTPVCGGTNATFAAAIAAVLLATSAGAWWGGGRPDGGRDRSRALRLLVLAVPLAVVAPALAGAVAGTAGAFVGALVGFGGPLFALGAAGPVVVRVRAAHGGGAGRAAGVVLAASTAASLVGCYATPLVLLADLGIRLTCVLAGALLVLVAFAVRSLRDAAAPAASGADTMTAVAAGPAPRAARRALVAATAALVVASAATLVPRGPLRTDTGQVEELESAYQTVRSVEAREVVPVPMPGRHALFGGEREVRTRFLRFDEDAASYQSVRLPDDEAALLTAGRYYDHLALGAWFGGMPWTRPDGPLRVLVVGYCGGTLHRTLVATAPAGRRVEVVGVELDPAVIALARRHLGPLPDGLVLHEGRDAREVVEGLPTTPFDLVLVDAYQRTQYVPFQLATVEFFRAVARRLAPTGAVAVNMNAPDGLGGALLDAVATSMARGLGPSHTVWLAPNLQYATNAVVWGCAGPTAPRLRSDVPLPLLVPAFTLERFLVRATRRGTELTDDRAPVERLADEALLPVKGRR